VKQAGTLRVIILGAIGIGGLCAAFVEDRNISMELLGAKQLDDLFACHVQNVIGLSSVDSGSG
jgi:hypothetical protein